MQAHQREKVDGMNGLLLVEQSRKVDVCEERLVQSHQSDMNGLLVGQSLKVYVCEERLVQSHQSDMKWPVAGTELQN